MSITTKKMILTIGLIVWSFTLLRSLTIMIGGKKIFIKASRGEKSNLYPILNLFSMLEIVDISTYAGILFFVPVLNIFLLTIMSYKLGKVFKTGFLFKIGLVILPIIFYPWLGASKRVYKVRDVSFFKAESARKADDINLMVEDVKVPEPTVDNNNVKVDSIFKTEIQQMEQVAPYKAAKIDLYGMEKLKNKDNNTKSEEKKSDIETLDL